MSERASVILFLIGFLLFAEFLSWETANWMGPCLILETHGCPVFHEGVGILIERLFEFSEQHDKSIVALFTVILAIATIALGVATVLLWDAGERQIRIIKRAVDTGREEFLVSHRPEIRIKHFRLAGDIWQGEPIVVELWCVNTGTS